MTQEQYQKYLSIIADEKASKEDKERANKKLLDYIKQQEGEIEKDTIEAELSKKMTGEVYLYIDGKEIKCNLEELLEDAMQYYSNVMPCPKLHILHTDIESLYREVYLLDLS